MSSVKYLIIIITYLRHLLKVSQCVHSCFTRYPAYMLRENIMNICDCIESLVHRQKVGTQ